MAIKKKKLVISSKDSVQGRVNRNARVVGNKDDDDPDTQWDREYEEIEQQLSTVQFDNMEKDGILVEIQKVDKELLRINFRLAGIQKNKRHIYKGDSDALTLQLRTLKQRSDMLFKCLDKVLPDKKELTGNLNLTSTEVDQIPDKILKKIIAGTITEEEYEHYQHVFDKAEAQETKH